MKHSLFLLCLAIALACGSHHTAAGLLTEPNPTPTELNSPSFVSDGAYQVAGIYHIVDYSKKMESYFGKRVNDDEYNRDKGDCGTYGYVDNCSGHQIGSVVKHPVPGLTCYEECICDTSYYKYSSSNCASPKVLGGENCIDFLKTVNRGKNGGKLGNIGQLDPGVGVLPTGSGLSLETQIQPRILVKYTSCSCPAEYNLSVCPTGANCVQCDSKYKFVDCKEGYTASGNTCVKKENCSAYPLTVCPTGGTCSKCPDNTAKLMLLSCDTSKGWKLSGNTCTAVDCPAGYTRGVTSCTSGSTKPDYASNGWSGGLPCGLCKCNNVFPYCTMIYPLTSVPANATYESCTTGCGSEKVTRYHITSCNEGWHLAENTCAEDACPAPYICGLDSCSSDSDKPDYHRHATARCGEKVCGYCSCDDQTDCSAYTLSTQEDGNAMYDSCSRGCGSSRTTTYKFINCKSGYGLKNGKCEQVESCTSYVCQNGWADISFENALSLCRTYLNKAPISQTCGGKTYYQCSGYNGPICEFITCPNGFEMLTPKAYTLYQASAIGSKCYRKPIELTTPRPSNGFCANGCYYIDPVYTSITEPGWGVSNNNSIFSHTDDSPIGFISKIGGLERIWGLYPANTQYGRGRGTYDQLRAACTSKGFTLPASDGSHCYHIQYAYKAAGNRSPDWIPDNKAAIDNGAVMMDSGNMCFGNNAYTSSGVATSVCVKDYGSYNFSAF